MLHGVHAEAVHADLVQPVIGYFEHVLGHSGVVVVQVGHTAPEQTEIITLFPLVPAIALVFILPDVVIAIWGVRVAVRIYEPGMLAGGMVENQVNDDADVAFVRFFEQGLEIVHCAVFGVDGVIIEHVISVIGRRWVDGHQPDGGDAERFEIVQLLDNAVEIADTVIVRVVERADEYLVEDGGPPPVGIG